MTLLGTIRLLHSLRNGAKECSDSFLQSYRKPPMNKIFSYFNFDYHNLLASRVF